MVMTSILSLQWGGYLYQLHQGDRSAGRPPAQPQDLGRFSLKREEEVVLPVCQGRVRQPARIWG